MRPLTHLLSSTRSSSLSPRQLEPGNPNPPHPRLLRPPRRPGALSPRPPPGLPGRPQRPLLARLARPGGAAASGPALPAAAPPLRLRRLLPGERRASVLPCTPPVNRKPLVLSAAADLPRRLSGSRTPPASNLLRRPTQNHPHTVSTAPPYASMLPRSGPCPRKPPLEHPCLSGKTYDVDASMPRCLHV